MTLRINYRLTGQGWAECTLVDAEQSCTITASYLSDALFNLLLASTALLSGFSCLTFSFEEEPGEYRWVITSPRLNEIELRILSFGDLYGGEPESAGQLLFQTTCIPETFAMAVHSTAAALLTEHGEAGYLEKWLEYPFPTTHFNELSRLLSRLQPAA